MSTEDFLRDFHRQHPGCTSIVLATGLTDRGETSYDIVAAPLDLGTPRRVLDLACGDGYLLQKIRAELAPGSSFWGVDLSPDELAAAKRRLGSDEIRLQEARAQQLPFADQSMDAVLCHLAFMLMDEIEAVVAEIHRVLAPHGVFSAVVMGAPHDDPATHHFRAVYEEILAEEGLARPAPLGDERVRTPDGIRELFRNPRFAEPVRFRDFVIEWRVPPAAVVQYFELTYGVGRLSPGIRARFAARYLKRLADLQDGSGLVRHAQSLRQFDVRSS